MKQRLFAFDNWLLERFPVLWHTKLIYLLVIGGMLWIAYFITGYVLTDLAFLKEDSIKEYFFDSALIAIHISLCLIIITFWALAFYKKSPLRCYYPTGRFYLLKQFIFLHLGFLPLAFCHIPFEAGMKYKTRKLIDLHEFNRELHNANLAIPFLPQSDDYYDLSNRIYPYPFPLNSITFDKNSNSWEKIDVPYEDYSYYHAPNNPENTIVLADSNSYQFYKTKRKWITTECTPRLDSFLNRFYLIDKSTPVQSILNYSSISFDTTIVATKPAYSSKYERYKKQCVKRIHSWINANRKDLILHQISQFEATLKKYEIPHFIEREMWIRILAKYNYQLPTYDVFEETLSKKNVEELEHYYKEINGDFDQYLLDKESYSVSALMGYHSYNLDQLKENCYWSYYKTFSFDEFAIVSLIFCFGLSLLLLLLNFTPLIQLIIAIPIGITLAILTALMSVFIYKSLLNINDYYGYTNYFYRDGYVSLFNLMMMLVVLLLTIRSFRSRRFSKKLSGVLLNLSYAIAPGFLPLLIFTIDELTKTLNYTYCNGERTTHTWVHDLVNPVTLISFAYAGFMLYLVVIKWWFSKPE